jgi:hypothetical protein
MEKELFNLVIFGIIIFIIYYVFNYINSCNHKSIEGLTNNKTSSSGTNSSSTAAGSSETSNSQNGIAGNAQSYAATIKSMSVNLKDKLLIPKYRADYETVILNYDDLLNSMMLEKLLDMSGNQMSQMSDVSTLNQAKTALNSIMKFVDAQ